MTLTEKWLRKGKSTEFSTLYSISVWNLVGGDVSCCQVFPLTARLSVRLRSTLFTGHKKGLPGRRVLQIEVRLAAGGAALNQRVGLTGEPGEEGRPFLPPLVKKGEGGAVAHA